MHLAIYLLAIFAAWKWSDWRNWQKYHATLLFLPFISLVYNFLAFSSEHFLWKTVPDLFFNHAIAELGYIFIVLPCTALLFLSNYPKGFLKVTMHFLKYIFVYGVIETIVYLTGRMEYSYGWSIWHSIGFYFLMFPSIIVHHTKPLLAYIIFILITIVGVWLFQMPIK